MSKNSFSRISSFRKSIKPVIDIDEDEDDKRRDLFGRKRVDVIQCLLESSSSLDENDDRDIINQNFHHSLWLTFAEICHIRYVLTQTILSTLMFNKDKQYSKILHGHICFRCRKPFNSLVFLPSFLLSTNSSICYICQQRICKKCSVSNFLPPLSKHCFLVRIEILIKTTTTLMNNEIYKENQLNQQRKTICYDCSQIFNEHRKSSQCPIKRSVTELRQSFSPNLNAARNIENNHLSSPTSNDKIGNRIITTISFITRF